MPKLGDSGLQIEAKNIGGIEHDSIEIEGGINVLSGRNATNRTSLLQSIAGLFGSDFTTLRAGSDEGFIRAEWDGGSIERTGKRYEDTVTWTGESIGETPDHYDLFAFLFETNKIRQNIHDGKKLREFILEPVDINKINEEIESYQAKRDTLQSRLETIESELDRLPQLKNDLESKGDKLEHKREKLAEVNSRLEELREKQADEDQDDRVESLNEKLTDLREERGELVSDQEDLKSKIGVLERQREAHNNILSSKEPEELHAEIDEINQKIESKTTQRRELIERKNFVDELENQFGHLTSFHEDTASGANKLKKLEEVGYDTGDNVVTDLLSEHSLTCPLCHSEVTEDEFESAREDLFKATNRLRQTRSDIETQEKNIKSEIKKLEKKRSKKQESLEDYRDSKEDIARVEEELTATKEQKEEIESKIASIENEIQEVEEEYAEASQTAGFDDEYSDLNFKRGELENEIRRLKSDVERIQDEISNVEEQKEAQSEVRNQIEDLRQSIQEARDRKRKIIDETVETFNDQMEEILSVLDYDRVEQLWIERNVDEEKFEVHVVREGGVQDTIQNLSESERQVSAIIFAFTGYLIHDIYSSCPVVILDSVEMIDSERLNKLLQFIEPHVEYLVVAALPEDTQKLDFGKINHTRIPA